MEKSANRPRTTEQKINIVDNPIHGGSSPRRTAIILKNTKKACRKIRKNCASKIFIIHSLTKACQSDIKKSVLIFELSTGEYAMTNHRMPHHGTQELQNHTRVETKENLQTGTSEINISIPHVPEPIIMCVTHNHHNDTVQFSLGAQGKEPVLLLRAVLENLRFTIIPAEPFDEETEKIPQPPSLP